MRYDLLLHHSDDEKSNEAARQYTRELITRHVSGRLKVAPEHTSDTVLNYMRKPSFQLFYDFKRIFDRINKEEGLRQQLIPYFISSHPGCREKDMAQLADLTKKMGYKGITQKLKKAVEALCVTGLIEKIPSEEYGVLFRKKL